MKRILPKVDYGDDCEHEKSYEILHGATGLTVNVLERVKGDYNKWHNPKVTTDIFYDSFFLKLEDEGAKEYVSTLLDGYITQYYEKQGEFPTSYISNMSEARKTIEISLPTSTYAQCTFRDDDKIVNEDIFPLRVSVDWEDKSSEFFDFDYFGDKAVEVAYEMVVNGVIPNINSARVDLCGVQRLRDEIFNSQETPLP